MRGHLVIHVGGFKYNHSHTVVITTTEYGSMAIPDRLVPARKHDPGSPEWMTEGWAVGDNARDRFCKWYSPKPKMKFKDYDEAVAFIHRMRQKRKARREDYTLVYVLKGADNNEQYHPVSFLDEILAIDREYEDAKAAREDAYRNNFPEIDALMERHGPAMAYRLSLLLAAIRKDGMQKTLEGMSRATFYRYVARLRNAGLLQ